MSVYTITKSNFEAEVINADKPVLIDFWASWCGPCRTMSPIIDAIAEEHEGQFKVGKVNVDEEPELAQTFGVMSIPTISYVSGGEEIGRSVGAMPAEQLLRQLGIEG